MSTLALILAEIESLHLAPRIDAAERIEALESVLDLYPPADEAEALALARIVARRDGTAAGRALASWLDARPAIAVSAPVASAARGLVTALARDLEAAWRRHDAADRSAVDTKAEAARAEMTAADAAVSALEWALAAAFPLSDDEVAMKIRLAAADCDPMSIDGEAGRRAGLAIRAIGAFYEERNGDGVTLGKCYTSICSIHPAERFATPADPARTRLC